MTDKKRKSSFSFTSAILNLIMLVPNLMGTVSRITSLMAAEARLAGKSIILLITLSIVLASFITSTWICLLVMLFVFFTSLGWSVAAALTIIFLLNLLTLIIILFIMLRVKKNLLFPKTRRNLFQ